MYIKFKYNQKNGMNHFNLTVCYCFMRMTVFQSHFRLSLEISKKQIA